MNYCEICETLISDEQTADTYERLGMLLCEECMKEDEEFLEGLEDDLDSIFIEEIFGFGSEDEDELD